MSVMSRLFRLAAIGDSTTVGVGANDGGFPERLGRRLKARGVPVGLLNVGQSGARVADAERQAERVVTKSPDLVTVGIGGNDVWRLTSATSFAASLARIADILERTGAPIVVCTIPDLGLAPAAAIAQAWVGVTPAVISTRVRELNAHVMTLARRPRFAIADVYAASVTELPKHPEYFSPDGFHPSAAGYELWAEACWPAVWAVAEKVLADADG